MSFLTELEELVDQGYEMLEAAPAIEELTIRFGKGNDEILIDLEFASSDADPYSTCIEWHDPTAYLIARVRDGIARAMESMRVRQTDREERVASFKATYKDMTLLDASPLEELAAQAEEQTDD